MKIVECKETEQIQGLAVLARAVWEEHYVPIVGAEAVAYMVREFQSEKAIAKQISDGYRYFAAAESGCFIAYCAVKPERDTVFLSKLYTAKEHRGKGCARVLLSHAVRSLGYESTVRLYLLVNQDNAGSIAAYERMGLTITEAMVNDIGGGFIMRDYKMEGLYTAK